MAALGLLQASIQHHAWGTEPNGQLWCAKRGLHKRLHEAYGTVILHEVTFSHAEEQVWEGSWHTQLE